MERETAQHFSETRVGQFGQFARDSDQASDDSRFHEDILTVEATRCVYPSQHPGPSPFQSSPRAR
jgi:hypothetical protein